MAHLLHLRTPPTEALRPLALTAITLADGFWPARLHQLTWIQLPAQFRRCEESGRIENLRRAAGLSSAPFQGRYYNDSDVYKWVEAASSALLLEDHPPELPGMLESVVEAIEAAQQPDGYLNSYFTIDREDQRWRNLRDLHELYCAGHLIQAAVAHRRSMRSDRLLEVALRLADHICRRFGPDGVPGVPGHQEIELALVELWRETGEERYLTQARRFIDLRGSDPPLIGGSPYHQDHLPFLLLDAPVGHAVRMIYYCCGAADLVLEGAAPEYLPVLERLWQRTAERRMYVTGGLGARWDGEAFGGDWELPNARAYAETCAGIAGVMWSLRMLLLTGESRFADLLELQLYNAVLPGLGLDGEHYFYQNPLADDGNHRRRRWFDCACCPPNVARLLAQLPGYLALEGEGAAWIHQYAAGLYRFAGLDVEVSGGYPWHGRIELDIRPGDTPPNRLLLRVPAWCESAALNGEPVAPGGWAAVAISPGRAEQVCLELEMPARRIRSHPYVLENQGRVAVARGPLIYCAEECDQTAHPRDLVLPAGAAVRETTVWVGGEEMVAVDIDQAASRPDRTDAPLYSPVDADAPAAPCSALTPCTIRLIPYFAWANRDPGAMCVWLEETGA